jgi:alpha-ketoglutarate-dependent taurine dioxygenase
MPTARLATAPVVTRLSPKLGVAVEGIDLNQTPDAALAERLRRALLDHQVLCPRDQDIDPARVRLPAHRARRRSADPGQSVPFAQGQR